MRQVSLLRDVTISNYAAGETIFSEGEPSDALFFVIAPADAVVTMSENFAKAAAWDDTGQSPASNADGQFTSISVSSGQYFGAHGLLYR